MSPSTHYFISYLWLSIGLLVFIVLNFVTVPFGRHTSSKWGVSINNKIAWTIMEVPSFLIMLFFLVFGSFSFDSYAWILFVIWLIHYGNRTFIYPRRIKKTPKKMPLAVVFSGIMFNIINAGLNGYYLSELAPISKYDISWLGSGTFIIGASLFVCGIFINWKSDSILINLRKKGETDYKIPKGFLFDYVTSPNLLGEIIEWTGFAIMAFNLPALGFMIWTFANLVPRAKDHHHWYMNNFPNFPKNRKILFPFFY